MNTAEEKILELVANEVDRKNRLEVLLFNSIKLIDINFLRGCMSLEEKLKFLEDELGITTEEIEDLGIIEECGL